MLVVAGGKEHREPTSTQAGRKRDSEVTLTYYSVNIHEESRSQSKKISPTRARHIPPVNGEIRAILPVRSPQITVSPPAHHAGPVPPTSTVAARRGISCEIPCGPSSSSSVSGWTGDDPSGSSALPIRWRRRGISGMGSRGRLWWAVYDLLVWLEVGLVFLRGEREH